MVKIIGSFEVENQEVIKNSGHKQKTTAMVVCSD